MNKCEGRKLSVNCYAKRYAAKEAASKALGTGFRKGVFWRDLEVSNLPSGQPTIIFHGGAKKQLESKFKKTDSDYIKKFDTIQNTESSKNNSSNLFLKRNTQTNPQTSAYNFRYNTKNGIRHIISINNSTKQIINSLCSY